MTQGSSGSKVRHGLARHVLEQRPPVVVGSAAAIDLTCTADSCGAAHCRSRGRNASSQRAESVSRRGGG